jgi:UDP-N-acetylmuramyl pentapeptide phosphotransferase/UDP-N-acetylglucosamine-1-phosphate transferase
MGPSGVSAWESTSLVLLAAMVVLVSVPLLGPLARRGLRSHPGGLNPEPRPVPLTGGLALFAGTLPVVILGRPGLLLAFGTAIGVGVADDLWDLAIPVRIGAWMAMGILVWLAEVGPVFGGVAFAAVAAPPLVAGVNFLDGSDGVASAVVGSGLLGLAVVGGSGDRVLSAAGIAALAAFLIWNHPPARAYLGNSGATLIAAWLLVAVTHALAENHSGLVVGSVTLCVLVPLAEVATTACRRWRAGIGLLGRERGHGYDRLVARGWSAGLVASLYGGFQLGLTGCAVVAIRAPGLRWPALGLALAVTVVVALWNGSLRAPPVEFPLPPDHG